MDIDEVRTAYDTVALQYHTRFGDELAHKPYDRAWLDRFAEGCARDDRVVEVGCGDGHVAAYLANRGVRVDGLDLSPAMVAVARGAYPTLTFASGNLLALPFADASVDAIVSFYSIVNLTPDDCAVAFGEFRRVLRPHGRVTLAFHIGSEEMRIENWWTRTPVSISISIRSTAFANNCARRRSTSSPVKCVSRTLSTSRHTPSADMCLRECHRCRDR